MRNVNVLMTANMAPAKPPPPEIFDTFIWGPESFLLMPHLLTQSYHKLLAGIRLGQIGAEPIVCKLVVGGKQNTITVALGKSPIRRRS